MTYILICNWCKYFYIAITRGVDVFIFRAIRTKPRLFIVQKNVINFVFVKCLIFILQTTKSLNNFWFVVIKINMSAYLYANGIHYWLSVYHWLICVSLTLSLLSYYWNMMLLYRFVRKILFFVDIIMKSKTKHMKNGKSIHTLSKCIKHRCIKILLSAWGKINTWKCNRKQIFPQFLKH